MSQSDDDAVGSPEEQAKEGTEESLNTAKLRADVARQQMRLAKDQLRRARKRFKDAKREARRARKLADVARRAWKRKKRQKNSDKGVADGVSGESRKPEAVTARMRKTGRSQPRKSGARSRQRAPAPTARVSDARRRSSAARRSRGQTVAAKSLSPKLARRAVTRRSRSRKS